MVCKCDVRGGKLVVCDECLSIVAAQKAKLFPNEVIARKGSGGSIIHVLALNENGKIPAGEGAICGATSNRSSYTMTNRGGKWYEKRGTKVSCPKCLKIINAR